MRKVSAGEVLGWLQEQGQIALDNGHAVRAQRIAVMVSGFERTFVSGTWAKISAEQQISDLTKAFAEQDEADREGRIVKVGDLRSTTRDGRGAKVWVREIDEAEGNVMVLFPRSGKRKQMKLRTVREHYYLLERGLVPSGG